MGGITLLVITDGRAHCLDRTINSVDEQLPDFDRRVIVNDSVDYTYGSWLEERYGGRFDIIHPDGTKRGFAGAIQAGWEDIASTSADWVWHQEDDFLINRYVPIHRMCDVMLRHPELVQLALVRQPWSSDEIAAGGLLEQAPNDYRDRDEAGDQWLEHRRFFTTNPSLYRASLCHAGWPQVPRSEGIFTHWLLEDPAVRFGYWGRRSDKPWVTHIGNERVGTGY